MAVIIKLNRVRGSFLVLGEPEEYKQGDGKPRWSATALIQKIDAAQLKIVNDALIKVAQDEWPKDWQVTLNSILGDKNKCCFLDGDKSRYDGYAGNMSLASHRGAEKGRPLVYDSDKTPIYNKETNALMPGKGGRLYSGAYVNIELEIWAQNNTHGRGIRATLMGIQRAGGGDAFGGGSAPNPDSFGEVAEGAQADDLS